MERWTQAQIKTSIKLIKEGLKYCEIGDVINKSHNSVRCKLHKLGFKYSAYNIPIIERYCFNCKKPFITKRSNDKIFCGSSCAAKYNNKIRGNYKHKYNICLNCKEQIHGKKNYCSNKCQGEYTRKISFEKIKNGDISQSEKQYKRYLISVYGEKCMECGWDKINPVTGNVPIQIDHIDGHSENNSLNNLKLLCPNCHSLTPTYGALNKGNGRKKRYKNKVD